MGVMCMLVGSHFVPPAKALVAALRDGTTVRLQPDPDNPHDAQAIRVMWAVGDGLPEEGSDQEAELQENLAGFGRDIADLHDEPGGEFMLGHIGREANKAVARGGYQGNSALYSLGLQAANGRLRFGPDGEPLVEVLSPGEEAVGRGDKLIA